MKTIPRILVIIGCLLSSIGMQAMPEVTIGDDNTTKMSNGAISIRIDPKGRVVSCRTGETELIGKGCRWYLSYNSDKYHELDASRAYVRTESEDMIEVVYTQDAPTAARWSVGYILRKNCAALYTYVVCEGTDTPEGVGEARMVYRLDDEKFHYAYISEEQQGEMPHHSLLAYAEKNSKIQDATFYMPDSSIYTKYNWSAYLRDDHYHGIQNDSMGVWAIGVSREYVNGGPMKQDIMVHSDAKSTLLLQMFQSGHFGAGAPKIEKGMTKFYGPFILYINTGTPEEQREDAARMAARSEAEWPFAWMKHEAYPIERSAVSGRIRTEGDMPAARMRVVLAQPGNEYRQGADYIYWTETDKEGRFTIPNVRPNHYCLSAYALEGENTDRLVVENVDCGKTVDLGEIAWEPTKMGTMVFRIGEADRMTTGFGGSGAPRAYELGKTAPTELTYTVGKSTDKDWFYLQPDKSSWKVVFKGKKGDFCYLTASVAGASQKPVIDIYLNGNPIATWDKWEYELEPSVYRSANGSGAWQVFQYAFPANLLKGGNNTLEFRIDRLKNRGYGGVMWDCIKLEVL